MSVSTLFLFSPVLGASLRNSTAEMVYASSLEAFKTFSDYNHYSKEVIFENSKYILSVQKPEWEPIYIVNSSTNSFFAVRLLESSSDC